MDTDNQAVARWDFRESVGDYEQFDDGDYVLFTDHEQVVAELNQKAGDTEYLSNLLNEEVNQLRSALAAKSAEVEGLKKDAERYRWLKTGGAPAVSYLEMCPSSNSWDQSIDAAMEKSNEHQNQ